MTKIYKFIFLIPLLILGCKSRISQNESQILHDLNFALEEFFLANDKLANIYGKNSLKRAASRQLNYIKKYSWKEMTFEVLYLYFLASLRVIKVNEKNFGKTRIAFRNIKFPQFKDHCFTGDYPVVPIDKTLDKSKFDQLSFLSNVNL